MGRRRISDAQFEQIFRPLRRRLGLETRKGILGDSNGAVYDTTQKGFVWVRLQTGVDSAGDPTYGKPFSVRLQAVLDPKPGKSVTLGYDHDNELAVIGADFAGLVQQGYNPLADNAADPRVGTGSPIAQGQLMTLRSEAIATASSNSTDVIVRGFLYVKENTVHVYAGEQVALSSYIPSSGEHRIAALFFDLANEAIEVVASTAQSQVEPLGEADLQECVTGASAGTIPVWAWKLYGGQTTILNSDTFTDFRQFINTNDTNASMSALFAATADATVANTTDETSIIGTGRGDLTLSANYLTQGKQIQLKLVGTLADTGTPTLNVKVKLGSTTICSTGAVALSGVTDVEWMLDVLLTCTSSGASGSVTGGGMFDYDEGTEIELLSSTPVTVDTTSSQELDVTVTWGTADAANTITSDEVAVWSLDPNVTGGSTALTGITVEEEDGSPSVTAVDTLKFSNGSVTDNGDGSVSIAAGGSAIYPQIATAFIYDFEIVTGVSSYVRFVDTAQIFATWGYQNTQADGDAVQVPVLLKAATYDFEVLGTTDSNRGLIDWSMDGTNFVTGQDWYSASRVNNVVKTGTVTIASDGRHLLKLTINGKNASSSSYYFGITRIILRAQTLSTET